MPGAVAPVFGVTPRIIEGAVSVANTNRDGTGTIVNIGSGGTNGSKVTRIRVTATGTVPACEVTLFFSNNNGTTWYYYDEFSISSGNIVGNLAPSTTAAPASLDRYLDDLDVPSTWALGAAVTVAPTSGVWNVMAFVKDA